MGPEGALVQQQLLERKREGHYSPDFFSLQLRFAKEVAERTGASFEDALLSHTTLYRRFGFEGVPNAENEGWKRFLHELQGETDTDTVYRFYLERKKRKNPERKKFGCFAFDYKDGVVRMHFTGDDKSGLGPLSRERIETRRAELEEMFRYIKTHHPEATTVRGSSWLYGILAYRRLFPHAFAESVRPSSGGFQSAALWGQFVDHNGNIKEDLSKQFLEKVKDALPESIGKSFPHPVLCAQCDIKYFYESYGIE